MKRRFITLLALITIILSACTPSKATRGNFVTEDRLADIKIGNHTKSDVMRDIGSPTTVSAFDENTWYYIGRQTEKHGFLDPKLTGRRILILKFNEDNILTSIEDIQEEELANLPLSDKETPTAGQDLTFLQQLLGNIGRFSPPQQ